MFITRKEYERKIMMAKAKERKKVLSECQIQQRIDFTERNIYDSIERNRNEVQICLDNIRKENEDLRKEIKEVREILELD